MEGRTAKKTGGVSLKKESMRTALFFLLTFLWTWACYFAIILMKLDPYQGAGMVLLILGGCSPTFVGMIMAMATFGKEERISYLHRIIKPGRIKTAWWLFILFVFPVFFAAGIGINMMLGGTLPGMVNAKAILNNPVSFFPLLLLSFMSGPFSEELGWRGYALDKLLDRFGFVRGSLLLGLLWGIWHLPLYLMPQTWHGQMGFGLTGFWMFLLMSVGLSYIMSYVYLKTQRSILSAMMLHLMSNFTAQLMQEVSPRVEVLRSLFIFALGAALAVWLVRQGRNAKTATRAV
jgi:membrane protease YdiL (CAAX protease family)